MTRRRRKRAIKMESMMTKRSVKKAMKAMMITRRKRPKLTLLCSINKHLMKTARKKSLTLIDCLVHTNSFK